MPETSAKRDFFCSELSLGAGEPLYGTAPRTDVWFLLEHSGPWAAKAFLDSSIAEPVKQEINSYLASVSNSRLLLIKKDSRPLSSITFYIALSHETSPALYQFHLKSYKDLLALDILEILSRQGRYDGFLREEPIFLVCTNGKRDRCCSKLGLGAYRELFRLVEDSAWQCTHVGAHRFAANMLCFPHGIYYGRVREGEIADLANEYCRGKIRIGNYRGRSCYDPYVQAAEYYLLVETGADDISKFRFLDSCELSENSWQVRFSSINPGETHSIRMSAERGSFRSFLSCKDKEESDVGMFQMLEHKSFVDEDYRKARNQRVT